MNRRTEPTQVQHPVRSTIRTTVQVLLSLLVAIPLVVAIVTEELAKAGYELPPQVTAVLLGIAGVVTVLTAIFARLMAIPAVEETLRRFKVLSWLAAGTDTPVRRR